MGWDVLLLKTRGGARPIEEMANADFEPLGEAEHVRRQISELLPGIDWSDPSWGMYNRDACVMEFNIGQDDPVHAIMLHVRRAGDGLGAIMGIIRPLGWSALDVSTMNFLDSDASSDETWKRFQAYRDKAIPSE